MSLSQQAPLVERPHSAKCLGERFQDAFLAAWGQERGVAYADLTAEAQAKWNRAAVAFVCTLSDAPSEAAARITELEGDLKAAFREISKLAREAGEATGRLEMSEAAGIVDGWRERAERAEARCRALENASPAEPSGWRPIDQAPDLGRKIVALFGDGSGASMFWRHDGGYIDAYGDEWGELPDHYALWTYLPDSFQFWCEYRSDEPMTLTLPPTSEGGGA